MANYLLVSILFATLAIPIRFSKAKNARAGLRKTVLGMAVYIFLWTGFCAYVFLRLGGAG